MISIEFNDFINLSEKNNLLFNCIDLAFGNNGLGLIEIKNIPSILEKRKLLLTSIKNFAEFPENIKNKYVNSESYYSVGWSHGKEKMKTGVIDLAKGSYYANPIKDIITTDSSLISKYPEIYTNNIWPDEIPELEKNFKDISKILIDLGYKFCQYLDIYLQKKTNLKHEKNKFFTIIKNSDTYKGRMLHYFPSQNNNIDGLCGWHLDHGCITILLSPLYFDLKKNIVSAPNDCGLYIKNTKNENIKIEIPEDSIVIQLGEMFQYLSGGLLRATPHCVKSGIDTNLTREQLALFMDCSPDLRLDLPEYSMSFDDVVKCNNLPIGVPELKSRIIGSNTYKDFVNNTIKAYYN